MSWGHLVMGSPLGPVARAGRLLANDDNYLLRAEAIAPTGNRWCFAFSKAINVKGGVQAAVFEDLYAEARLLDTYSGTSDPRPRFYKLAGYLHSGWYRHMFYLFAEVTEYILPPAVRGRVVSARVRVNGSFVGDDNKFYRFNVHDDYDHYATLGDWLDSASDGQASIADLADEAPHDVDISLPESVIDTLNEAGANPVYLYHVIDTSGFTSADSYDCYSIGARTRLVIPEIT